MEWTNETISEFLILYENEPALWNSKSSEHKNKNDQHDSWVRIQTKLKDCTIPIKDIKKKRDTLMATYRKLRCKISESTKSGSGTDEIYKPDWPFYNDMSKFLDVVYIPRKTKNSVNPEDKDMIEDHHWEIPLNHSENDDRKQDDKEGESQFKTPIKLPKRPKRSETEKKMDEAYDCLKQMTQKLQTPQDECSLYTQLLCKKLRGLKENTREIAMLEIDRLIFNLKQNEILTSNPYAEVPPIPQAFNFGQSHQFPYFRGSAAYNSHRPYSPQQSSRYHSTPSPQQSSNYHPSPSSQQSKGYNSTPSPQQSSNYHPSPSSQQSKSYNSTPSPQQSPNYHPSISSQQSTGYNSTPSPQQSSNYHPSPSSHQSKGYNSTPSPQQSPNYHPSPSSTGYTLSSSPNQYSSQQLSPQMLQIESLVVTSNNELRDFYEQESANYV